MQSYRQLVRHLKKSLPEIKLSVRRVKLSSEDYGECNPPTRNKFTIKISNSLDEVASKMILLHECAHALSWHTDTHPSDHGPEFGKAYARVWRIYQDWLTE